MIVYHGSYIEIKNPDILYSRDSVDFGKGFYITPIKEQAVKWASRFKRNKGKGVISSYELNMDAVYTKAKVLEFNGYTEAWLDYIISCRSGKTIAAYDVVIGGVANDKVFNTIELFIDGLIDKTEAIKRLRYEKPNLQICICSQKIINDYMTFIESEDCDGSE